MDNLDKAEQVSLAMSLLESTGEVVIGRGMGESTILPASVDDSPPIVTSDESTAIVHDGEIKNLREITGCNEEDAMKFLSFFDWNFDNAISVFLETGSVNLPLQQSANAPLQPPPSSLLNAALRARESSAPLPIPQLRNNTNTTAAHPPISPWRNSAGSMFGTDDDDDNEDSMGGYGRVGGHGYRGLGRGASEGVFASSPPDEYDEEGIRRPDSVKNIRLISSSSSSTHNSRALTASADDPSVEWMFPPPIHISFPGTLAEARDMAKQQRKWLIVNLQSHTEFASHMLNRDTWSNEMIETMLRENFVFWQRGHTSDDGRSYMDMYKVSEGDLPHVAIIDSRTGAKLVNMKGFIEPDNMCISLVEFLDSNSFDKMKAPKERNIDATQSNSLENLATSAERHSYLSGICRNASSGVDFSVTNGSISAFVSSSTSDPLNAKNSSISVDRSDNYGPVLDEPVVSDENVCRISFKLPSGKNEVRRFRKGDSVRSVYAFVKTKAESGKPFDLHTTYPPRTYGACMDSTISEQELGGSQVIVRYK